MSSKPDRHNIDVFPWLRTLPVAPEYRPTLAEFQDPIAYIFKIEKEASRYGICKIVPPLPPASKKTVVANFNKSVSCNGELEPVFTTRQQQIGFCPRRGRPVRRSVWQSGELYTFQEFEVKAKAFEKSYLSKCGGKKAGGGGLSALEIETLYWQASVDKPFSVEYANDMPGSAFSASSGRKRREGGEGMTVGDTAWNMKGVARSALSLLRFMKEDIAGVTSPMVYVAMLFSWFAWHVEDHDLHSLNYLHTGADKTWYGVPKEAAAAFEEVVRVHGYGGEINPLVTFATLGEKTTVMSPEIFVKAGIPCCRLVQNPGEFVVTFPRAYHSGFSHGFNCGEASNMAAPDWLSAAKEAAVRRASINYPPMVSHFQLLYDTIFELCSRLPLDVQSKPRSSRLKQKRRPEGETVIKQLFIEDIKASNQLLQLLGEGSPVVLQPQSSAVFSMYSKSRIGCLLDSRSNSPLRLFNQKEAISNARNNLAARKSNDGVGSKPLTSRAILKKVNSTGTGPVSSTSNKGDAVCENNNALLSDQRLFSCVTCGILCFSCVAIIQPTEAAAKYLMSSDCSFFSDSENETKIVHGLLHASRGANTLNPTDNSGWMGRTSHDSVYDVHIQSPNTQYKDQYSDDVNSENEDQQRGTALDFLASAYGSSSDSEDNMIDSGPDYTDGLNFSKVSPDSDFECDNPDIRDPLDENDFQCASTPRKCYEGAVSPKIADSDEENHYERALENRNLGNRISMGSNFAYLHSDEDSSRMHVFCLEHAMEVKKKLQPIGGTHILLLCHSDYPRVEVEAKAIGEELGLDHCWNETAFREAFEEDENCIATALESAEDVSSNGDWAVKLGINLFYSASLSRSPLYSKQMPYNSVVYKAFGRVPPSESPAKSIDLIKGSCKRKKIVLAGKWCGKAWMSNQVHPLLQPPAVEDVQSEDPLLHSAKTDSDSTQEVISAEGRRGDIAANPSSEAVGMKRQIVVYSRSNKKSRRTEAGQSVLASDPIDAGETFTHRQPKLYSRSKHKIKGDLKLKEEKTPVLYHRNKNVAKGSLASGNETTSLRDLFKPNFEPFGSFVDDKVCGPSTRLRKRIMKPQVELEAKPDVKKEMSRKKTPVQKKPIGGKMKETDSKLKPQKLKAVTDTARTKSRKGVEGELQCDVEGCTMTFSQKQELSLHRQNICPVKGCGKTFFSHKYLLQHRRVHDDERPLKCPWKGCKMTFKWAWARTEHIRVHTGVRPYICAEPGCGQTFRFVSDFSRHKRKTGHSEKKTIKYLKNQAEL